MNEQMRADLRELWSWRQVRGDLRAVWAAARYRPNRAVLVLLGATLAAATFINVLVGLVLDPMHVVGLVLGRFLLMLFAGGLTWGFFAGGALVMRVLIGAASRNAAGQLGPGVTAAGAVVGGGVAWLVMVIAATYSLLTVLMSVVILAAAMALTRDRRRHAATLRWLVGHLVGAAQEFDPQSGEWTITGAEWAGDHLVKATAHYPATVRVSEPARRAGIERAVMWAMRHEPYLYTLRWSASARAVDIISEPPLPDRFVDATWPRFEAGIPLAVCAVSRADVVVQDPTTGEQIGLRCWDPRQERDLLICGVKGSGKTVACRRLVVHGWRCGWWPGGVYILDGKSGDDYIPLEGRAGMHAVAVLPPQWQATLSALVALVDERYAAKRDYAAGRRPDPPRLDRVLVLIDEIQNVLYQVPEAKELVNNLARMARAAGVSLVFATQRPDAADAIPGAIRDQLEDRLACGWMSPDGARMTLAEAWRLVVDDDDSTGETATISKPRGRAVSRIGGRLDRIQIPWMDSPVGQPQWEPFYPPREAPAAPEPPRQRPAHHDQAQPIDAAQGAGDSDGGRRKPRRTD